MLKPVIAGTCLCAAATMAWAQSPGLSGQQISDLVAGATVEIATPAGTKLPVRYAQEGRMSGEARDLAWYLGSAFDTGRWWVAADQLCHKWSRWFNSEPQCMRLSKEGRVIRWRTPDGNSGTAVIAVPPVAQASALPSLPRLAPKRNMPAAAAEPPPALAAPPAPAGEAQAPAETAGGAGRPSQPAADETVATMVRPAPLPAQAVAPAESRPTAAPPAAAPAENRPPQDQAEPKRAAQPLFTVANVRHDDVLNVRSGPSPDFDVVGELQPGSRGIAVTSACRSKWCPVQHHATSGWVNSAYLAPEAPLTASLHGALHDGPADPAAGGALRDSPEAPRTCLTPAARALLDRMEQKFGPVQVVSTCRPGAMIAGTGHPSRHASGNAVDFNAGSRKAAIIEWLIATHHRGGTMTYAGLDHIHVDIGPHFVSLAGGRHWSSWNNVRRDGPQAADAQR
jgi:hypothetical protein